MKFTPYLTEEKCMFSFYAIPTLFIMYSWLIMHTILPTTAVSYEKLDINVKKQFLHQDNVHKLWLVKCMYMQHWSCMPQFAVYKTKTISHTNNNCGNSHIWKLRVAHCRADELNVIIEVAPLISLLAKPHVFPHRLNWLIVWLLLFTIREHTQKSIIHVTKHWHFLRENISIRKWKVDLRKF